MLVALNKRAKGAGFDESDPVSSIIHSTVSGGEEFAEHKGPT